MLGEVDLRWPGVSLSRGKLAQGTVRPGGVVVAQVLGQHASQVVLIDDQQPVEQFPAQGTDHPFADRVRSRRLRRAGKNPDGLRLEPRRNGCSVISLMLAACGEPAVLGGYMEPGSERGPARSGRLQSGAGRPGNPDGDRAECKRRQYLAARRSAPRLRPGLSAAGHQPVARAAPVPARWRLISGCEGQAGAGV